jgi:ubiquinol-cytochrome c reductase iron-sulfur subunit
VTDRMPPAGTAEGPVLPDGPGPDGHSRAAADAHEPASGIRTPVKVAHLDDPHLRSAARNPARTEVVVALVLLGGIAGVVAFGATYWQNLPNWTLGVSLGGGLFLLGFGLTAWGKYLMPRGPFVEERHPLRSSEEERDAMAAALVQRTGIVVKRRRLLAGLFGLGAGIFGIVAIFPLLRSLGPLPGDTLDRTNWKRGERLVDIDGRPINVADLAVGSIMTVFPEGYESNTQDQSQDQTVLIRASTQAFTTRPGRETWTPNGYVAYSKLCTHLGCPVGLYEQELELLVCPCHQSMFNVLDGAVPEFGPAPRPLPQLPLMVDSHGWLRAQSGYDQAVGPGFWERTTRSLS